MRVRRALPAVTVVLFAHAFLSSAARGDALVVTQAMKASTIAEIFVESGTVRVELEIGARDLPAFRRAMPDEVFKRLGGGDEPFAERWPRFLAEDFVVRADGETLPCSLKKIELGRRVQRDVITGESLPVAETEAERVVKLAFTYTLATQPKTLTIRPPMKDGGVSATIGFVAYHEGIPVTDFRYLSLEVTLDLDWDDAWYSQFRHRNLRRKFAAPLSAFLSSSSLRICLKAFAHPSASKVSKYSPAAPHISRFTGVSEATTGRPQAIASTRGCPKDSVKEGNTNASARS